MIHRKETCLVLLNYDALCQNPMPNLQALANFVGAELDETQLSDLTALIKPPKSLGRYKLHRCQELFTASQIEAVQSLGFEVSFD